MSYKNSNYVLCYTRTNKHTQQPMGFNQWWHCDFFYYIKLSAVCLCLCVWKILCICVFKLKTFNSEQVQAIVFLTPAEWTIHLGAPVVPEEYMMKRGWLKGSCSNSNWGNWSPSPRPDAKKSSINTLWKNRRRPCLFLFLSLKTV